MERATEKGSRRAVMSWVRGLPLPQPHAFYLAWSYRSPGEPQPGQTEGWTVTPHIGFRNGSMPREFLSGAGGNMDVIFMPWAWHWDVLLSMP